MAEMSGKLSEIYRGEQTGVRPVHRDPSGAAAYYSDYVSFVRAVAPSRGSLLDIGCGGGWSSELFGQAGYETVGIDLALQFQVEGQHGRRFVRANAARLPFSDRAFDIVSAYQTIEHTPDPDRVLREALRVLRPGGVLCIVGPNLLSIGSSVRALTYWVWKNRPARRIFFRGAEMPHHPFGNTLPEAAAILAGNLGRMVHRTFAAEPVLQMREPDMRPPFHSDNDACFVCNPIDLSKYFAAHGCRILVNGKPGRPAITRMLASGTYLAVQKS